MLKPPEPSRRIRESPDPAFFGRFSKLLKLPDKGQRQFIRAVFELNESTWGIPESADF